MMKSNSCQIYARNAATLCRVLVHVHAVLVV